MDSDRSTLILTASEVDELLGLAECLVAVEEAFASWAKGEVPPPSVLGVHVPEGGFHVKAATLRRGRHYFAAKTNANFPRNGERHGLPSIQGVITLSDADTGVPLAVMDSIRITVLRTAAATGVAVAHLADEAARTATLVGCGAQAETQLLAVAAVRHLERVWVADLDAERARAFATRMGAALGIPVEVAADLPAATLASDIVVTCTPSCEPLLGPGHVRPGTMIAAVGADNPDKHEIHPDLMAAAKVVVDSIEQAAEIGDLHHAIEAGAMVAQDVHAELGAVAAGLRPGRQSEDEIIVFDSTGTALQDVASAALVYERALERGTGHALTLAG